MIKKHKKSILALTLIFAILVEILPAMAINISIESIQTQSTQTQSDEISVDIIPSTVDAEIPDTFSVDESCENVEVYEYTPNSERSSSEKVAAKSVETETVAQTEPDKPTEEESTKLSAITALLQNGNTFSALSEENVELLCEYADVESSDLQSLELNELTLSESLIYAQMAKEYGLDVADIYSACPNADDCRNVASQLRLYISSVPTDIVGSGLDMELRDYILDGYLYSQVKTAYGINVALGIALNTLLSQEEPTLDSYNLSDIDKSNYTLFASDLGVNANALINYGVENDLTFRELESLIEKGYDNEFVLNEAAESPAQSEGPASEEAVGTDISEIQPINTESAEKEISSETDSGLIVVANSVPTNVTEYPEKYLGAPYSVDSNNNESVNLNSGALMYETVDYTLPGINGLDLVIGRRYDSDEANVYTPTGVIAYYAIYDYYVIWGCEAYWSNWVGTGDWDYYDDGPNVTGPMSYEEAVDFYNSLPSTVIFEDFDGDTDLVLEYYGAITAEEAGYYSETYSSIENNSYFNNLYGLGQGWSFMFSSIEEGKYLRLSDGRTFEISITSTSGDSNLKDYSLSDLRLESESGAYSNGSKSSKYTLYYKDGKREYFDSSGKLIGIMDRFDNTIKFVNDTYNGYPRITITDTLNRVTVISGQSVTGGHSMTVDLGGAGDLTYTILHAAVTVSRQELSEYFDPEGVRTTYGYTLYSGGFNMYSKNTSGATNFFDNLTTITHPTGAQTVYTYGSTNKNLGSRGLQKQYRVTSRADMVGTASYNAKSYAYSSDNNSGYPSYTNPGSLPSGFTYYTIVTTTENGVGTQYTFNYKHLTTLVETKLGSTRINDVAYQYNSDKLPTQITTKQYDYSDQSAYIQSINAYTYDNKANVTASWSPLAEGSTSNTEYKTTNTYDSTYGLLLTSSYKQDSDTTVLYQYTLDSAGKTAIREEVFVNGSRVNMTDYAYDGYGNIVSKKQYKDGFASYNQTQYSYSNNAYLSEERITGVLDPDNASALGSPGGSSGTIVKTYEYDNAGLLTQMTDQNGNETSFNYELNRNVYLITNPDNTTIYYMRNYTGNYVRVTDEGGRQFKYTYTPLGLDNQTIDVATNTPIKTNTYDALSRLTTVVDSVYGGTTAYTYDYLSRVTSETVTKGTETLSSITYAYSDACENGTLQKSTKTIVGDSNAPSIVTTSYNDKMGFVAKTGKFKNGTEYFDTYTYDYIGNKLTEKLAYAAQLGLSYSSKWVYDYAGRATKSYNADQNYTQTTYDALGNLVSSTDYAGTAKTFTYDSLGRLLMENTVIDGSGSSTVYGTKKYYYDAAGNIVSTKISDNAVGQSQTWKQTDYAYDDRGWLEYVTLYNDSIIDSVTKYEYDGVGNQLSVTTGLSSPTASDGAETQYVYDRYDNMLMLTDPLGQAETYEYSSLGRLISKTDRNGNVTAYVYDGLGRVLSTGVTVDGVTDSIVNAYTLTGAKKSESNATETCAYQYNELGQLIRVDETGGIVKTYGYDLAGNRTAFALAVNGAANINTTYTYDNQNRLSTVKENGVQKAAYTYDANGNRASLTYANGSSVSYTYNKANWVTGITNKTGSTVLSSYAYTYYADGNQRTKTNAAGVVTTYTYDDAGRLTNETEGTASAVSYGYDRFSNRTQMAVTGSENYTTVYTYDANNRLLSEVKTAAAAMDTTDYYYDPNGNMIAKTTSIVSDGTETETLSLAEGVAGSWLYRYNGFNQLTGLSTDNLEESYAYAPSGLRVSKTTNGTQTSYVLDGDQVVRESVSGTTTAVYIRGINLICSTIGSDTNYYLYNGHGDVVQLANTSGIVTKEYDYDAFGNEKNPDAADTNPFRYCGEYLDLSSGAYYLRARYYDPAIGRFLSEDTHWNTSNMIYGDYPVRWNERKDDPNDPLGLNTYTYVPDINAIRQSSNLYVYCCNNPIIYVDRDGHIFMLITGAIGAIIGGVAGGIYSYVKYGEVQWQNVAVGAAAGGAIGLTGGAATAYIVAGSATASTGAVLTGIGVAGVTAVSSSGIALGTQFDKLGKLITNPKISVDWANTTAHGLQRMAERGVTQTMVETWMKSGKVLQQTGDKFLYITKQGVVVVNKAGQVITAYGSKYFDSNMQEIVKKLFGK